MRKSELNEMERPPDPTGAQGPSACWEPMGTRVRRRGKAGSFLPEVAP